MRAGIRTRGEIVPRARTGGRPRCAGRGACGGRIRVRVTGRPPYRTAACIGAAVLAGYLITLAPTVTFWDAGEFITAARTLGIPHPPGSPLYVLLASVWGRLVPLGGYAWRIN